MTTRPVSATPAGSQARPSASFEQMWSALADIGRSSSGGYRRFAWTPVDLTLREWFAAAATSRSMQLTDDRAGNQWAWWGDPDAAAAAGTAGIVAGSHLDSVPDGGAFDGPLGVLSAFAAIDALRADGFEPARPVGVVNFVDEEGARFGVACAGSRILTGRLDPDRMLRRRDSDGVSLADALMAAGRSPHELGRDDPALRRIGAFVELHVEQGRGLVDLGRPVAIASGVWPHGRWRIDLPGEANHAGTTRLADRDDPMLALARTVLLARDSAARHDIVATCGKLRVEPNGVNAIASLVTAWLDARGREAADVHALVDEVTDLVQANGGTLVEESWSPPASFDDDLRQRLDRALRPAFGEVPVMATGAGHDSGVLAEAGIPTAMLFVRNPTGISHSPQEFAEHDDCLAGVAALATVVADLAS